MTNEKSEKRVEKKEYKGLRKLRAQQLEKEPRFYCDNCKKTRFSPCTCAHTGGKREERFVDSPVS